MLSTSGTTWRPEAVVAMDYSTKIGDGTPCEVRPNPAVIAACQGGGA